MIRPISFRRSVDAIKTDALSADLHSIAIDDRGDAGDGLRRLSRERFLRPGQNPEWRRAIGPRSHFKSKLADHHLQIDRRCLLLARLWSLERLANG